MGLYKDNGKERGNYHIVYWAYVGLWGFTYVGLYRVQEHHEVLNAAGPFQMFFYLSCPLRIPHPVVISTRPHCVNVRTGFCLGVRDL